VDQNSSVLTFSILGRGTLDMGSNGVVSRGMSNPQRYNIVAEMNRERDALTRERNTFRQRLTLANKALADIAHLLADIDHPNARAARIGALRTLDATDLINPNL
jgi:hypothetical protein